MKIKQGLLDRWHTKKNKLLSFFRIRRELMGVSEIVMAIVERKIPVVGHNGLHDLMYLYHYFITNLPGTACFHL